MSSLSSLLRDAGDGRLPLLAVNLMVLVNYVRVDDIGRVINPMIVRGQIHGRWAQVSAQHFAKPAPMRNPVNDQNSATASAIIPGVQSARLTQG
jgi:hypothetical protein